MNHQQTFGYILAFFLLARGFFGVVTGTYVHLLHIIAGFSLLCGRTERQAGRLNRFLGYTYIGFAVFGYLDAELLGTAVDDALNLIIGLGSAYVGHCYERKPRFRYKRWFLQNKTLG
ncbi:MAG: hypothetical protein OXR66_08915 [Candidatus Woesearchaeota archaeon]|nr:hypothetical protein [Candidatus Woesearchaeota archaeon]